MFFTFEIVTWNPLNQCESFCMSLENNGGHGRMQYGRLQLGGKHEGRRMLNLECGCRPNRSMWSAGWPTSPADRREAKPTVRAQYLGWPQTLTNKTPRINQISLKNDDALPSVHPLSVALELKAALSQWTGVKTGESTSLRWSALPQEADRWWGLPCSAPSSIQRPGVWNAETIHVCN